MRRRPTTGRTMGISASEPRLTGVSPGMCPGPARVVSARIKLNNRNIPQPLSGAGKPTMWATEHKDMTYDKTIVYIDYINETVSILSRVCSCDHRAGRPKSMMRCPI